MATLNEVMKYTADAIREKTGKSELIKHVVFAEEIRGISAGGSGESGDDGWEYYKVDSSFRVSEDESITLDDSMKTLNMAYYMGTISSGVLLPQVYISSGAYTLGFKVKGEGRYYDLFLQNGITSFKDLAKEPFVSEFGLTVALPFFNALTPCTKEEFEALITA